MELSALGAGMDGELLDTLMDWFRQEMIGRGIVEKACFEVPEFEDGARGLSLPLTLVCDTSVSLSPYEKELTAGVSGMLQQLQGGGNAALRAVDVSILCFDDTVRVAREFGGQPGQNAPPRIVTNLQSRASSLFTALFVALCRSERRKGQLQDYQKMDQGFRYFQPMILLVSDYGANDALRLPLKSGGWSGGIAPLVQMLLEEQIRTKKLGFLSAPFGGYDRGRNGGWRSNLLGLGMYEIDSRELAGALQNLTKALLDTVSVAGSGEMQEEETAGQEPEDEAAPPEGPLSTDMIIELLKQNAPLQDGGWA